MSLSATTPRPVVDSPNTPNELTLTPWTPLPVSLRPNTASPAAVCVAVTAGTFASAESALVGAAIGGSFATPSDGPDVDNATPENTERLTVPLGGAAVTPRGPSLQDRSTGSAAGRHHDRVADRTLASRIGGMRHQRPVDRHCRRPTPVEVDGVDEAQRARHVGGLRDGESKVRGAPAVDGHENGPSLGVDTGERSWVAFDDKAVGEARVTRVDEAIASLRDLVAAVPDQLGTAVDDRVGRRGADRATDAVAEPGGQLDAVTDADSSELADPVAGRLERRLALSREWCLGRREPRSRGGRRR